MATDKEAATAYRLLADYRQAKLEISCPGRTSQEALTYRKLADELDPPKPEYPDGTIAWITYGAARKLAQFADGKWCDLWTPCGHPVMTGLVPDEVEPLRVLADDEIPLPRSAFAGMTWEEASKLAGYMVEGGTSYKIWSAIADALRDEGERP